MEKLPTGWKTSCGGGELTTDMIKPKYNYVGIEFLLFRELLGPTIAQEKSLETRYTFYNGESS